MKAERRKRRRRTASAAGLAAPPLLLPLLRWLLPLPRSLPLPLLLLLLPLLLLPLPLPLLLLLLRRPLPLRLRGSTLALARDLDLGTCRFARWADPSPTGPSFDWRIMRGSKPAMALSTLCIFSKVTTKWFAISWQLTTLCSPSAPPTKRAATFSHSPA